jgi:hypothetical protein
MHRTIALTLPAALAGLAIGATAAFAGPAAVHKTYRLSATLAPAPHAKGAAHAHGSFTGKIAISGSTGTLSWTLTYKSLTGPATMAHIHLAPSGKIIVPLCLTVTACKSPSSGHFTGPLGGNSQILKAILGGHTYVNVHTAKNPTGEIRGFLRAQLVP